MQSRKAISIILILLGFSLLLSSGDRTSAQTADSPLILLLDNNIWTWDKPRNTLKQLTTRGYISDLALSPDGNYIAYKAWSDFVRETAQRETNLRLYPNDIFVLHIESGIETQLTEQSLTARYIEGVLEAGAIHSAPVWSPDGAQLAWVSRDIRLQEAQTPELWIHNFLVNEYRHQLIDWEVLDNPAVPPGIVWGQSGILLNTLIYDPHNFTREGIAFLIYDLEKNSYRDFVIPSTLDQFLLDHRLVEYDGREYLGVQYNESGYAWELINLDTGDSQQAPNMPELYSLLDPAHSLAVTIEQRTDNHIVEIRLKDAQNTSVEAFGFADTNPKRFTLSPDGQALAYILVHPVHELGQDMIIWRDGELTYLPGGDAGYASEILWGPVAWRIGQNPK